MPALTNDFSWSRSRDATFQECRRKYFYQYYGSWGGWEPDAAPEVRRLYVLKQLASRQMWAGRVVHDAVEMALHIFREGREVPVEPFVADVIERMRGEWRASRAGRYRDTPKTLGLFEHEYALDLKREVWQALSRNVATCLRNFFRLPLVAAIRATPPEHWSIEHWSKLFEFEGTPMWTAPDFGFWTADGRLALVDWKTGAGDPDGAAFQLGCYALYAREVLGVEPARVDLFEVNLREPHVTVHVWDEARLQAVREQLRLSIRSMRAYLVDPVANVARLEDFEKSEDLRICRWCNFRAVCRPGLTPAPSPV
ncbi:MAG TPA: PD-(D/E)XK nuclease family protein [Candidatus Tectomicrobia bacterium]|nr:PD-(D/E)XK nuclease family protein [Candidatus Tectomicrobia bacterium]